jgi:aryl-alcohol dehydrogenase-like predicted oxidoreductase
MSFNTLNAANLHGLAKELPLFRSCGLTTYQGSPLYMGLLGDRYAEFQQHTPAWFDKATLTRARQAKAVADRYGLALAELAHRFLLTVAGPDYVVLGARTPGQLRQSLLQLARGPLPIPIFDQLTQAIQ